MNRSFWAGWMGATSACVAGILLWAALLDAQRRPCPAFTTPITTIDGTRP